MLEGDAHEWWCNVTHPFTIQGEELTWALFEGLFHEEYFPQDIREAKQGEFDKLVQGSMIVDAYLAKFNELVKFTNYGGTLPTPEFLSAKFQRRLSENIATRMSNTAVRNFADLVTQCKRVETVYGRYSKSNSTKEQEMKRTSGLSGNNNNRGGYHHNNNRGKGLQVRQPPSQFKRNGAPNGGAVDRYYTPQCGKCKKYHKGVCGASPGACFKCGRAGHFARSCPSATGQAANLQALPTTTTTTTVATAIPTIGRVYTTNAQHTERAPNLVKGIIFISNIDLSVLFDSGATHSFVAEYVAKALNLKVTRMVPPMPITTATGEVSDSSYICEEVEFVYEGRGYTIDLIIFPLASVNLILGMD
ncbi:uncharacterized protein LOC133304985 [Gastrolobium bilobum]|uniref:uncharacterized protein LOC133304985 n=1 Tax=Gastrolobium bilobum TaxID=150636 RepID=UPI002AB0C023|nr:uncharacterized protein LOC133304985 [Gastrolobium bilobum]